MTGLSLVWDAGRDLPAAPIEEHAGRAVTWEPWKTTPATTHVRRICEQVDCLYVGSGWMTVGTVHPLDSDTIERTVHRRTRSGRQYGVVDEAPAHPLRTLYAFACAKCHHITAYEMTGADRFVPVSLDQGVLF